MLIIHGLIVSSILLPPPSRPSLPGILQIKSRLNASRIGTVIFAVGAALEAGAVSLGMFISGRALAGVGERFFLSTVVVYIREICPPERRGRDASLGQLLTPWVFQQATSSVMAPLGSSRHTPGVCFSCCRRYLLRRSHVPVLSFPLRPEGWLAVGTRYKLVPQ